MIVKSSGVLAKGNAFTCSGCKLVDVHDLIERNRYDFVLVWVVLQLVDKLGNTTLKRLLAHLHSLQCRVVIRNGFVQACKR